MKKLILLLAIIGLFAGCATTKTVKLQDQVIQMQQKLYQQAEALKVAGSMINDLQGLKNKKVDAVLSKYLKKGE